ncbi:MAG: hypothetical protein AAGC74_01725 [Verrucomicrobiota bacterium]
MVGVQQIGAQAVVGFTEVMIDAAPSATAPQLTAISVTFLNKREFSGQATIQDDFDADPDGNASTSDGRQSLSFAGASFAAGAYTAVPHLIYLENENGAEEGFLILEHDTSGGVTISTNFDLRGALGSDSPFPAAQMGVIRRANTLDTIFQSIEGDIHPNDSFYLWSGSWKEYNFNGYWQTPGNPFSDAGPTVVFPDEGMFVLRSQTSAIALGIRGEVPEKVQSSSVTVSGLKFASNRYPIASTLGAQGIENLDGWNNQDDDVYLWSGTSWRQYNYDGSSWRSVGNPFVDSGSTVIEANTAIFLSRSASTNTRLEPDKPYGDFNP